MALKVLTEKTEDSVPGHMLEFREGLELLKNEYPEKAVEKLRQAFENDRRNPYYISFLGLSIARAEQNWEHALELCETAVRLNRKEIKFHLNLIEVYSLAGWREKALHKIESAAKLFGNDSRLKRVRAKVVERRSPVLPFLERGHFLNRELGKLRHRMLKRKDR